MAKSNSFFGLRRGSTKSHTYQVLKGQQITKDRVSYVSNPRSDAQMTQRSQFLSAVRFYQRSNQRFFRFAFENKRQRESEYNAFMRANAKLGGYITKAQGDNIGFPMVAPWVLSQGSLSTPQVSVIDNGSPINDCRLSMALGETSDIVETIGEASALLLATYNDLRNGDIVTVVCIRSEIRGGSYVDDLDAIAVNPESPIWETYQFKVDTTDTRSLMETTGLGTDVREGVVYLDKQIGFSTETCACAVVFSRNTDNGLKVSTSSLVLNALAASCYEQMRSSEHLDKVLAWWGAQQMAILQGSIAEGQQGGEVVPVVTKSFTFEGEETEQQGTAEGVVIPYFTPSMVLKGVVSSEGIDPLEVDLTLDSTSAVTRAASLVDTDYDLIDQIRVTRESDGAFKVTTAGFFEDSSVKFEITQWVVDGVVLV